MSSEDTGQSLLHAAEQANTDQIRTILSTEKADPDAKDASGSTSLHHAAKNKSIEAVELLLEYGADPNANGPSDSTPLHYAAEAGDARVVELLLGYGADPNAKGSSESTPLHYAAEHGHDTVVQQLLDYWADLNAQNDSGSTPLHVAVKAENERLVKLFLSSGANSDTQDKEGNNAWHFATTGNIFQLLKGEAVALPQPTHDTPMFPITVNGNTLDESHAPAAGSLQTKYILVQSRTRLNQSDRKELDRLKVEHLDYVSKNTYLCRAWGVDLESIRKLEPVIYVDGYRNELKITPSLKEIEQDQPCKVDIVYHENVDTSSPELQRDIVARANCNMEDIEFLPNRARLSMLGRYLETVASIDDVRCVERVGRVVKHNDAARQIMKLETNRQPSPGLLQRQAYTGFGQVIAVADTGLDQGKDKPLNTAFANGVHGWYTVHGPTEELDGHGTHVCGSAIGDGSTNGRRITGTAPQAKLIVQSIWDPAISDIRPPSDLTDLFKSPYFDGARVHSNSWGTESVEKDEQGNPIPFEQIDYNSASRRMDEFVNKQPDMVICFSAGNRGRAAISRSSDKGHIGAEAAAKNCITVGASRSTKDCDAPSPDAIADFSSRGPVRPTAPTKGATTKPGGFKPDRYKPDLVAPGTWILSANSSVAEHPPKNFPDQAWCYMDGTSMATPLVAGCAAVLREALLTCYPTFPPFPKAALIKSLLVNGADILKHNPTPRFVPGRDSGFGRVNMANTIRVVHGERATGFREGQVSNSVSSWREDIDVQPVYRTLKATLVWSDPPGAQIKNDLQLVLRIGTKAVLAVVNNTVQQVVWKVDASGRVQLEVRVLSKQLDTSAPQDFAVVWRLY